MPSDEICTKIQVDHGKLEVTLENLSEKIDTLNTEVKSLKGDIFKWVCGVGSVMGSVAGGVVIAGDKVSPLLLKLLSLQ